MLIVANEQPVYYSVSGDIDGSTIDVISDISRIGDATAVAEQLTVVSDSDPNAYLGKLPPAEFPDLPDSGWLEQGEIYNYGGTLVMVRQDHNRLPSYSVDNITLYIKYRPDAASVLDWVVGEPVEVGMHRIYNSIEYVCLQAHVTQSDWTPDRTPALWSVYVEPTSEWSYPFAYKIGDQVTYLGILYECIQAHTSQAGWHPDVVPALWKRL